MMADGNDQVDILVVEDSLSGLNLLVDILEAEDYCVRSAQSAKLALELIKNHSPDLVLLDIKMPEFDGLQLCEQLKAVEETQGIPIIFVSALDDIETLLKGFDFGAVDYITKPFHAKEVLARVNTHLSLRKMALKLEQQNQDIQRSLQQKLEMDALLIESEKMASLGRSVAAIAHELNTPMGLCVTATSYLQDKSNLFKKGLGDRSLTLNHANEYASTVDETLEIIMTSLNRSTEMVNNFKMVAVDVSSEKLRTFAIIDYLSRVVNSLTPELRKTKHNVNITGDDLLLTSYPGALSQVITNIVMNSLIHAFDDAVHGNILIRIVQDGSNVHLNCSDDGKGMSPESLKKVFEAYYTTREGQGGSGLGTSIINQLVTERLQGQVSCSSELGTGTMFTITLPITLSTEA